MRLRIDLGSIPTHSPAHTFSHLYSACQSTGSRVCVELALYVIYISTKLTLYCSTCRDLERARQKPVRGIAGL